MVSTKLKTAMGLKKSPKPPSPTPPPSSSSSSNKSQQSDKGGTFSRSFGVYFPRKSSQVQPRPPDANELLRLVAQLRERESLMKTQLIEQQKSIAIVPFLENQVFAKDLEIAKFKTKIDCLETENERVREEVEMLHLQISKLISLNDEKLRNLESQISDLKKISKEEEQLAKNVSKCRKDEGFVNNKMENEVKDSMVVAENVCPPRNRQPPPCSTSSSLSSCLKSDSAEITSVLCRIPFSPSKVAPPPPPPLPGKGLKGVPGNVRRVPEVVEFYHSLMRRDSRRESSGGSGVADEAAPPATAKDMIGEIENRSAYLLAIKTDVETQGDFIRFLIKEVENAAFTDIGDVVPFVKWLDDELSFLVDERAVLKHFDWPEQKADALREAAFSYCDLKKLESEASSFRDDPRHHFHLSLKKMQALFEKLEHGVYNLSRMRESSANRYKVFNIPTNWMQDTECVSQIKMASVKLAMKYMKRISAELELETHGGPQEDEELIVQGVRFAFRVHQFAGGFDTETMSAFQELRDKARS